MNATADRFRFLGTTDEVQACDCCGRTNLKNTVALETPESGIVYFGVVCAGRALAIPAKEVRKRAKSADDERHAAERAARAVAARERQARWESHLVARLGRKITDHAGRIDVFKMIEALGGYDAAHKGFAA